MTTITHSFAGFDWPRDIRFPPTMYKYRQFGAPVTKDVTNIGTYLDDRVFGLRWAWCDEVSNSIDHRGWFCDEDQHDKFRGIVLHLTHGRGFLAGWSMGDQMATSVYVNEIHESIEDAAWAANEHARMDAENERIYREEHPEDI